MQLAGLSSRDLARMLVEGEIRTSHLSKWAQTLASQVAQQKQRADDADRRATLNIRPATPNPDFEPEEEWKSASDNASRTFKPAVGKLEGEFAEKFRNLPPPEDFKVRTDDDNPMAEIRHTANEEYYQLLDRERQEVRWAAGEKANEKWAGVLMQGAAGFLGEV